MPWLFSPTVDLAAFLGTAVLALGLVAVGSRMGYLQGNSPEWVWITAVLLVDVAHVYATGFRVYFDPAELRRRPVLYAVAPLIGFILGAALYSEGEQIFWRTLAYLAVFHFVRQQYGWVALYRSRGGEQGRLGWWIDTLAIYAATLYPLLYWHAHLPRRFDWFLPGDFVRLPALLVNWLTPVYWGIMAAYVGHSLYRAVALGKLNPGKDIVVLTTAICWYVGIVSLNSDFAFTVTNVLIHGVPYLVLIYWYRWERSATAPQASQRLGRLAAFLGLIWLLAYAEELLWDAGVWHERTWLFGAVWELGDWKMLLVPLLAVPQITHYLLDGFIWRRQSNRQFSEMVGRPAG